jgi:WD40-like Beta Propeller Repeat
MPRIRSLSLGLVAILAACSPAGGTGTAAPTASGAAGATIPAATPASTPQPTVVASPVPTPPPGLSGRLLFARFTEASHSFDGLFSAAADGSGEVEVPMPWTEGGGRWSTSGDEIAIPTQLEDGRIGTAIMDPAGKVLRVLEIAQRGLNLPCTTWSPDDARLACDGWDDADPSRRGLYTVRSSDGGDMRRLTTAPAGTSDEGGDWSADGKIVFKRYPGDEGPGPLLVIDAAGGAPKEITPDGQEDSGRFSPDGKLVATSSGGSIVVYDLTGTKVSRIQLDGRFLFGPAWAPDGAWLVFSNTPAGQFHADLYLARPDGTDIFQATRTSANEIRVDWGP